METTLDEAPIQLIALLKAIDHAGNQSKLGRLCGVSPTAVQKWIRNGVSGERAVQIEQVTEGKVTRADLRPDMWPWP